MAFVTLGTAATFAAAAVLLATFFATKNDRFDRLAEWLFVVFAGFAIALAVLVQQRLETGSGLAILVTAIGIAGVSVVGLIELLSTLGRINFERYGGLAALGFAGWLAWIAGVSLIGLASGAVPVLLGWLGILVVAVALVVVGRFALDRSLVRGERSPGLAEMAPLLAVFVAVIAWLVWRGVTA